MRAIIQVVSQAAVSVNDREISRIPAGFLILLAVKVGDSEIQAQKMAEKIAHLRILQDTEGKMNLSLLDLKLSILLVSQFTLYGDCSRGNRPSFVDSARPEQALLLFNQVAENLRTFGLEVVVGAFGEHMKISLVNDGPTTIIIDL